MKTWKNFFPLMRCPSCRRWLRIRGRSEYKLSLASTKEIREVRGDDDSATPQESTILTRTREEGSDEDS